MKTYIPNPLDTEHIVLPEALNELTEQMARNVHEVWAKGRIDEGWSYGEQRDDQQNDQQFQQGETGLTTLLHYYDSLTK